MTSPVQPTEFVNVFRENVLSPICEVVQSEIDCILKDVIFSVFTSVVSSKLVIIPAEDKFSVSSLVRPTEFEYVFWENVLSVNVGVVQSYMDCMLKDAKLSVFTSVLLFELVCIPEED